MGFGYLLVGYVFAFGFTSGSNYILGMAGALGALILLIASNKLSLYSKRFAYLRIVSVILACAYIFNAVLSFLGTKDIISPSSTLVGIARALIVIVTFVFHAFLYLGIAEIAHDADDEKLRVSSLRDLVLLIVYYLFTALSNVARVAFVSISSYFSLVTTVIGLFWLVMSFMLVLNSYMRICLPEDKDMSVKNKSSKK